MPPFLFLYTLPVLVVREKAIFLCLLYGLSLFAKSSPVGSWVLTVVILRGEIQGGILVSWGGIPRGGIKVVCIECLSCHKSELL